MPDPLAGAELSEEQLKKVEEFIEVAGGLLVIAPVNSLDLVGVTLVIVALGLQFARRNVPVPA